MPGVQTEMSPEPNALHVLMRLPPRQPIRPVLSAGERRSYQAAWRILQESQGAQPDYNDFACESTRRSRMVERMAAIIQEEMGR